MSEREVKVNVSDHVRFGVLGEGERFRVTGIVVEKTTNPWTFRVWGERDDAATPTPEPGA